MAKHRHRKVRERGPYGCAGGVSYTATCSCGAERRTCDCFQCAQQRSAGKPGWVMPLCAACKLRHAADVACRPGREKPATQP